MPFEVRSEDVVSALACIERLVVRVQKEAKLPEPVPYQGHRDVSLDAAGRNRVTASRCA